MTFDAQGRLYIAAGGPGSGLSCDPVTKPGAAPELFFKSDEEHIRCLAWDAKGNLIAGSDGSGLVYRISPEGKGYVLFEAPRREITAVAVARTGPSTRPAWATRATIPCRRCPCRAWEPSPSPSCSRDRCRPPTPARPCPKEARSTRSANPEGTQAPRRCGPAKTKLSTLWPRALTACSRSPATAAASSRSPTTAATPMWPTSTRSRG
jgi:hypothetical protein